MKVLEISVAVLEIGFAWCLNIVLAWCLRLVVLVLEISACMVLEISACMVLGISACMVLEISACMVLEISACMVLEISACMVLEISACMMLAVGTRPHLMSRMLQGCCKDGQEVIKTRNMNRRTGRAIAGRARTDITLYGQCVDQIISSNRIEFCVMVMGPGSQYLSWSLAWLKLVTSCLRYSELH